jgi:hypothetical protein
MQHMSTQAWGVAPELAVMFWEAHHLLSLHLCEHTPKIVVPIDPPSSSSSPSSPRSTPQRAPSRTAGHSEADLPGAALPPLLPWCASRAQMRAWDLRRREIQRALPFRRRQHTHAVSASAFVPASAWALYEAMVNGSARSWTASQIPRLSQRSLRSVGDLAGAHRRHAVPGNVYARLFTSQGHSECALAFER